MKKLSNEEKWNIAQQIAKQLPEGTDVKSMSKADIAKYDERCNLLVEHLSQYDGKDYDEDDTLDYFLTLVSFHVAANKRRADDTKGSGTFVSGTFVSRGDIESGARSVMEFPTKRMLTIRKMMTDMFNISPEKAAELSCRLLNKDEELLIRHMKMWKENIEKGWLRDKDIPEAIYDHICRFLEGERPIVSYGKGKFVKVSEGEYRYEE